MSAMPGDPLEALDRYLIDTAVVAPPRLEGRIHARLLIEPPSTAPRRFLAALRARDIRGMLRGVGQNASTAFGPGTRSMVLRAQAMAIVLVTLASLGFGGAAGLAATRHAIEELDRLESRPAKVDRSAPVEPSRIAPPVVPAKRPAAIVAPPAAIVAPPADVPINDQPRPGANASSGAKATPGCDDGDVPASDRSRRRQVEPCASHANASAPRAKKADPQRERGDRRSDRAAPAKQADRSKAPPRGRATRPDRAVSPAHASEQRAKVSRGRSARATFSALVPSSVYADREAPGTSGRQGKGRRPHVP